MTVSGWLGAILTLAVAVSLGIVLAPYILPVVGVVAALGLLLFALGAMAPHLVNGIGIAYVVLWVALGGLALFGLGAGILHRLGYL